MSSGFPYCLGGGGRKAQAEYQEEPSLQTRQWAFPLLPGRVVHSVVASITSGTLLTRKIQKMTGFLKKEMLWSGDEVSQNCCFKSHGHSWNWGGKVVCVTVPNTGPAGPLLRVKAWGMGSPDKGCLVHSHLACSALWWVYTSSGKSRYVSLWMLSCHLA